MYLRSAWSYSANMTNHLESIINKKTRKNKMAEYVLALKMQLKWICDVAAWLDK